MRPAGLTMPTDGPSTHCVIFQSGLPVAPKHLFRSFSSPECANGRLHHPIHPDRGRCGRAEGSNGAALRPPHFAWPPCSSTSSGTGGGREPLDKLRDRGRSRALRQAQGPRVVATPFDKLRDREWSRALRQAQGPRVVATPFDKLRDRGWSRRPSTSSGADDGRRGLRRGSGTEACRAPFDMLGAGCSTKPRRRPESRTGLRSESAVTRP
jgi:hypothetical protein